MDDATFRVARVAAPLRQQVVESVRNAIASGRLRPGERLVERDLCELIGVSRTLIREALRQLEAEGLIRVIPNRGPIVASISPLEAKHVYQVRAELEGLASHLFAESATDAQIKSLKAAFENLRKAYTRRDPAAWLVAKGQFYDRLIEGCGNELLGTMLRQLHARVMLLRATSLSQPGRAEKSEAEIATLMKAITRRDGPAARAASVAHIARAAEVAMRILEQSGKPTLGERKAARTAAAV